VIHQPTHPRIQSFLQPWIRRSLNNTAMGAAQ
jgi:polar amino acid transport system ATP-binding protein